MAAASDVCFEMSSGSRIGCIAYVLGLGAWLTPWLGLMYEQLSDTCVDLPIGVLVLTSTVAALLMIAMATLMSPKAQLSFIVLLGGLGASLVFGVTPFVMRVLELTLEPASQAAWLTSGALVGVVFAMPLGLVLSVPAVVIAGVHQAGFRSHDDGDQLTALSGAWILLAAVFAVALTASDSTFPHRSMIEATQMLVMDAGAAILALGVGRSLVRRQWLRRARRGQIAGVRVRPLGPTESAPPVLPLVSLSNTRCISVIEVIERPAGSPYRGAEVVHPIALA